MPLWPAGKVPGAIGMDDADVPTLTRYDPAPDQRTGAAMVVCPGGGYQHLAEHEGAVVGQWLAQHGVTAFVLKYRLAPRYRHPAMLLDVSRAIRLVRHNAGEWGLDVGRVGVLGFSAGGHLAASVSTLGEEGDPNATDPIERQSARPDVSAPIYAVLTFAESYGHSGSRRNLIGEDAAPELVQQLSPDRQVTARTPPTFLFHTMDDPVVPVENSLAYAAALRRHGVPFELHIHERGRHGVGLAQDDRALRTWPMLCINWLALRGFARA